MTDLQLTDKASLIESVVIGGDLSKLNPDQRVNYYKSVCESLGLNPLTRPFDYITLNGKLTLYAKRDATDQLRKRHAVSIRIVSREMVGEVYIVTASATTRDGRTDESTGAVTIANLRGGDLANAMMKAETKAKRRVTLSIVGLGWLDETETEAIPEARSVVVRETGEIVEQAPGNGKHAAEEGESTAPVKTARIVGHIPAWQRVCKEFATKYPAYQTMSKGAPIGQPNQFHILAAAAKEGYAEITPANYEVVIESLYKRAAAKSETPHAVAEAAVELGGVAA